MTGNRNRTYVVTATGRRSGTSYSVMGQWPSKAAARAEAGPAARRGHVMSVAPWGAEATTVTVEQVAR